MRYLRKIGAGLSALLAGLSNIVQYKGSRSLLDLTVGNSLDIDNNGYHIEQVRQCAVRGRKSVVYLLSQLSTVPEFSSKEWELEIYELDGVLCITFWDKLSKGDVLPFKPDPVQLNGHPHSFTLDNVVYDFCFGGRRRTITTQGEPFTADMYMLYESREGRPLYIERRHEKPRRSAYTVVWRGRYLQPKEVQVID